LHQQGSEVDRRSVRVHLTDKGRHLREIVARLFASHAEGLTTRAVLDAGAMEQITNSLKRMERY
jgi:DNA-binding MarR family transcriptional regulator